MPYAVDPLAVIGVDTDHRHAPTRRIADLADHAVAPLGRRDETSCWRRTSLVVRPPRRLSPALPRRRRLLWLRPALRWARLVAGHVIAIAWTIAVLANVLVWRAPLPRLPERHAQAQNNTAMQPIAFALVLPAALSLYSLAFTIYQSRFR